MSPWSYVLPSVPRKLISIFSSHQNMGNISWILCRRCLGKFTVRKESVDEIIWGIFSILKMKPCIWFAFTVVGACKSNLREEVWTWLKLVHLKQKHSLKQSILIYNPLGSAILPNQRLSRKTEVCVFLQTLKLIFKVSCHLDDSMILWNPWYIKFLL